MQSRPRTQPAARRRARMRGWLRAGPGESRPGRTGAVDRVGRDLDRVGEGLLQAARHQGRDFQSRQLDRLARRGRAEPLPDRRGRHFGGLFQRHRQGPAGHHHGRSRQLAAQPQAPDPHRPQGPDQGHQAAQGPLARQQFARLDHQLRDRQDFGEIRAELRRCRPQVHPVPAGRDRLRQQGDRRGLRDPAVCLADRGEGVWLRVRRSGRFRHPASDDDRGQFHQYRLGRQGPGAGEEILPRLHARRARLLPSLSRRPQPQRGDRPHGAHRRRAAAGNAAQISLDRAQSRRPHQHRQHARYPVLLREGETLAEELPGRAAGNSELCRRSQQELGPFVLENKDSKLAGCR